MPRIHLVRHATHDLVGVALAGRMPGVPLSAEGLRQTRGLARHFGALSGIAGVMSSPVERCRQTADAIAGRLGLSVTVCEPLNELDCGEWTGRRFDALAADPRWQAWNDGRAVGVVPGGESAAAVATRVMALLDTLAAAEAEATVLVTHSDVIKTALLSLLRASLDMHDRLEIEPASITTVDLWPGGGKLVRSNQTVPA